MDTAIDSGLGPLDVPASLLGPLTQIGRGANGRIYRLLHRPQVVYKNFKVSVAPSPLRQLIRIRRQAARGSDIEAMTAWPTRVVIGDDPADPLTHQRAAGVLMPLIPQDFMAEFHLPDNSYSRAPRDVQHLIYEPSVARRHNVEVPHDSDVATRMLLCERLAFIVSVLHFQRIVYGDLSARNILYRLTPTPEIYLVDCDAARADGDPEAMRLRNTPDWDPPEHRSGSGAARQSLAADRYKLGLFILRCLAPGRFAGTNRDVAAARCLDPAGRELLRSTLLGDPSQRPSAGTWNRYWRGLLNLPSVPAPR